MMATLTHIYAGTLGDLKLTVCSAVQLSSQSTRFRAGTIKSLNDRLYNAFIKCHEDYLLMPAIQIKSNEFWLPLRDEYKRNPKELERFMFLHKFILIRTHLAHILCHTASVLLIKINMSQILFFF